MMLSQKEGVTVLLCQHEPSLADHVDHLKSTIL
jgi:hypothetical protein